MGLLEWFQDNWFTLLQSTGIIGSLLFTARAVRIDSRAQKTSNLIKITENHRQIWSTLFSNPDLKRVLDTGADVQRKPVTRRETLFVQILILHLSSTFYAGRNGMLEVPGDVEQDVRWLFSLPVPNSIWKTSRHLHERDFVAFMDRILNSHA